MQRVLVVLAILFMTAVSFGQTITDTYTAEREEQDNRFVRFGQRELHLLQTLHNDELRLTNDKLKNDIARLERTPQNPTRIAVDRFVIEQDKAAIETMNLLAKVWYRKGNEGLQAKLNDIEKQLDAAQLKCEGESQDDLSAPPVVYATVQEAQYGCADLHKIYVTVSRYQIKGEPLPSFFAKSGSYDTLGAELLRQDTAQLKKDMAAANLPADIKKKLVLHDEMLIQLDKSIWLNELTHASIIKHNQAHPEHLMANVDDVIKITTEFREKIASVGDEYRGTIQH